jgi:cytoskeleton protein RodZ
MSDNDTDGRNNSNNDQELDSIQNAEQPEVVEEVVKQDDSSLLKANDETPDITPQATHPDKSVSTSADDSATTPSFGQILRDERIRRSLSVGEVARRLRLSEQQVEAIEAQDFAKLPATTFLRGYVRNYANLLQLANVNQLLESLPQPTPAHNLYPSAHLSQRFKAIEPVSKRNRGGRGLLYTVVVMVLGFLAYGLYQNGSPEEESSYLLDSFDAAALSSSEIGSNNQAAIDLPLPLSPSSSLELPFSPPAAESNAQTGAVVLPGLPTSPNPTPVEAGISDSDEKVLHFSFSRDSWVKVKDSNGKVILEKTHARGTEQRIKGKPPLYLVIGNAHGVSLIYNGRLVDLAPYTRGNDDVARFSLE